jgi:hypothetical protein
MGEKVGSKLTQTHLIEIYGYICDGYSRFSLCGEDVYLKHLTVIELNRVSMEYDRAVSLLESDGILSEENQIENSIQSGWWKREKEEELNSFRRALERLQTTRAKLIYKSDKERIDEQIREIKTKVILLAEERSSFVSVCSESVALSRINDYFLKHFVFKDARLTEKLFQSESDYEMQDDEYIQNLLSFYSKVTNAFSHTNIKKLALSQFMQNSIYATNLTTLDIFGIPLSKCTKYQADLVVWAKYFNNMIKSCTKDVPESLYDEPDEFVKWFEDDINKQNNAAKRASYNRQSSKGGKVKSGESTFFFGDRKEVEQLAGTSRLGGDKIIEKAKESGGLSIIDLAAQ